MPAPALPPQGRETDPKRSQQDLLPVIPKQFSRAVPHTSAGVALQFSPAPGAGGGGSSENGSHGESGSNRNKGSGRERKSPPTPQLQPSIHTSWLDGDPLGRDGSFPSPLQLGTPKPTPKVH